MKVLLYFTVGAVSLCGQDWTPKRIVAITDYVPLARMARIFGDVQVKCFLDANGLVLRAEAVSGHPLLKEQARQNALLWTFQNSTSQPTNTVTLKYLYRLEGESPDQRGHTVFIVDLPNTIRIVAAVAFFNP